MTLPTLALLFLSAEEQEACRFAGQLDLALKGILKRKDLRSVGASIEEIHEHFPVFAQHMGLTGKLYDCRNGTCEAAALYFGPAQNSILIMFFRPDEEVFLKKLERQKEWPKILEAARAFGASLMPHINWNE